MTPMVSIIMCTRNRAHIIGKSIEGVIKQTFKQYELIVVDDGSTDNTEKAVKKYTDPRIRYIKRRWSGLASSRNVGLRKAGGSYIAYCDDDSIYYPFHIQKSVDFLEANPESDMIYSDGIVYIPGENRHIKSLPFDKRRLETVNFIMVSGVMHRRECIKKAGLFDEKLLSSNDWDMWLRVSDFCKIRHLPVVTVKYHCYDDVPLTLAALKNKGHFRADVIRKRIVIAKKEGRMVDYVSDCSLGVISNLISAGNLKYANTLSAYFYGHVRNYQTIACLALSFLARGNFKKAKKLLELSLKKVPEDTKRTDSWHEENILNIKTYLALTLLNMGNTSIAEKTAKEVLEAAPENVIAAGQLAKCYMKRGLFEKALRLLKDYACNYMLYNLRGICYFGMNDYEQAVRNFKNALIINPISALCRHNLNVAYSRIDGHSRQ